MTLIQDYIFKVKVTCSENPCPGHNSSLPSWILIIFHTLIVHDQMMCHDLDLRSYHQGQGNSAHIPKNVSGSSLLTAKLDLDNISNDCCP